MSVERGEITKWIPACRRFRRGRHRQVAIFARRRGQVAFEIRSIDAEQDKPCCVQSAIHATLPKNRILQGPDRIDRVRSVIHRSVLPGHDNPIQSAMANSHRNRSGRSAPAQVTDSKRDDDRVMLTADASSAAAASHEKFASRFGSLSNRTSETVSADQPLSRPQASSPGTAHAALEPRSSPGSWRLRRRDMLVIPHLTNVS